MSRPIHASPPVTFASVLVAAAALGSLPALATACAHVELLPTPPPGAAGLAALILVAATGRAALALLPAARNGSALVTWATSHLLGLILLTATSQLTALPLLALAAPWLLIGLASYLTGPGDLAPRHESGRAASPLAAALAALPLAAHLVGRTFLFHTATGQTLGLAPGAAALALGGTSPALTPATCLAALPAAALLIAHAVRSAQPAVRTLAPLALILLPAPLALLASSAAAPTPAALPVALLAATAAAVFGHRALLCADRRAAHLALASGLSLAWLTPRELAPIAPALALAVPLALFAATPAPGRRRIITPIACALVAGLALGLTRALGHLPAPTENPSGPFAPALATLASYDAAKFGLFFFLVDAAALVLIFRRPWSQGRAAKPNRPRPELLFAFLLAAFSFVFALAAQLAFGRLWPQPATHWQTATPQLLTLLAPSALLMLALSAGEFLPTRAPKT